MRKLPNLPTSSRWLHCALLAVALWPAYAHAQAIDRGRETDVLRLLLPYVDDGPVGDGAKLARIAIHAAAIELEVADPLGKSATLKLTPRGPGDTRPGSKSFAIETPQPPTQALSGGWSVSSLGGVSQLMAGKFPACASVMKSL